MGTESSATLQENILYTGSVWVKPSTAVNIALSMNYRNATGTQISNNKGASTLCVAGVWTRIVAREISPATTAVGEVRAWIQESVPNGFTLAIDGMMITEGPYLYPYGDPQTNPGQWQWLGTAHTSPSVGWAGSAPS